MTTFAGHFLGPGTHAARPATTGLPEGTMYVCTTDAKIERVVSGAWADYATLGSSGGGGPITKIFDSQLASAASSIDTGAAGVATTFLVLLVYASIRASDAVSSAALRINNDSTTSNYDYQYIRAASGTVTGSAAASSNGGFDFVTGGSTHAAGKFGSAQWTIPNPAGSQHKTAVQEDGFLDSGGGYAYTYTRNSCWHNTAAITRLAVVAGAGGTTLAAGSRLTIYGLA